MRRSALTRKTPLRSKVAAPRPRKPIRSVNPKRAKKKHERNFRHAEKIRALPCVVCGREGTEDYPIQSAHIVARGMGGCKGSYRDQVPMCDQHHKEYDAGPETWARRYPAIDLRTIADTLAETFDHGGTVDVESVFIHWASWERPGAALYA